MRNRTRRREADGFTMVEMITVVAILVVLAGISVPVGSRLLSKGAISATKTEQAALGKALLAYAQDFNYDGTGVQWGRFPAETAVGGGAATVLGTELESDLAGQGWDPVLRHGWNGPYLTAQPETVDGDGDGATEALRSYQVDAWGRYYRYRNRRDDGAFVTSTSDTRVVTLESGGPDRNFNTAGDNLVYQVYSGRAY